MSTATGQRVRPQLSVCNTAVSSTPAYHDHDVSAREEPVHAVVQATVRRVSGSRMDFVILGFRQMCFLRLLVLSGIIELSAVDRPYWRTITHPRIVVLESENKLVVVLFRVKLFMHSQEFMTTMRRPRRLFKIHKPAAHDNRIRLKHIPRNLPTADTEHSMCETIVEI